MSAVMREVRLLDRRPGEPVNEAKIVEGVRIETGVPIPTRHQPMGRLRAIMLALEVGESFVWPSRARIDSRIDRGRQFHSRKLPDGRYRVWRVK